MISSKLNRYLKNPNLIATALLARCGRLLPDSWFLRIKYFQVFGKILNLKNPKTFNEKLQWLKLYDRKPEYTVMVDKIEAKKWVADRIGDEYIIPTLGVWDSAEEIDFDSLPNQFVLKTNHDSGAVIICKDKSKFNIDEARKKLAASLKRDYYILGREWPYKDVKRRILAEKYMVDESGYELKDFKIFCFDGKPAFIQVDFDRFADSGHKRNLYSTNWEILDFQYGYPSVRSHTIERPVNLEEMLQCASTLSKGHPFLRVDFYSINGSSKFGETTFFPECGFGKFEPSSADEKYGQNLKISGGGKLTEVQQITPKLYFGELTFYPGCGFEEFIPEGWDYKMGQLINLN